MENEDTAPCQVPMVPGEAEMIAKLQAEIAKLQTEVDEKDNEILALCVEIERLQAEASE